MQTKNYESRTKIKVFLYVLKYYVLWLDSLCILPRTILTGETSGYKMSTVIKHISLSWPEFILNMSKSDTLVNPLDELKLGGGDI